ncbi:hypothetical protein DTO169E5_4024 [Paecilomyces variotii]|nr:hypothetical protein DTO169E5_4024 [Paecilomyces variotii]KAJ9300043.1 hypothetical protein DTO217A2_8008 [Paecilomyces variotii]
MVDAGPVTGPMAPCFILYSYCRRPPVLKSSTSDIFLKLAVKNYQTRETNRETFAQLLFHFAPLSIELQKATMAITVNCVRPTIRHFSARRPRPDSRASRFVASSCIASAVVLPFIPPAIESSREKSLGYPNHNKSHPPLCFHAR